MSKKLEDYIDKFGLIGKGLPGEFLDGGDTSANEFSVEYSRNVIGENRTALTIMTDYFLCKDNISIRHPDPEYWYSDLDRFSRDQLVSKIICLGFVRLNSRLWILFKQHLRRGLLFAWNSKKNGIWRTKALHEQAIKEGKTRKPYSNPDKMPDVTAFKIWGLWIRAFRFYPLYPLLYVLDLEILIGSIIKRYISNDKDQRNHFLVVDFSARIMPTLTSLLALLVYGTKTPREAFKSFWGDDPSEPPIDMFMNRILESNKYYKFLITMEKRPWIDYCLQFLGLASYVYVFYSAYSLLF